jgi:hypothetical protein
MMSSATLYRASGLTLLSGALVLLIGLVLRVVDPGTTLAQQASALYVFANVVVFSGIALLLFGWFGVVARLAAQTGWLGLAGALLLFLSGLLFGSISAYNFLATPWYAVHAPRAAAHVIFGTPAVVVVASVATWLVLGGGVLAAVAIMRSKLLSPWPSALIIGGAVLGLVFDYVFFAAITFVAAILLVVVGLAWMAYGLLTAPGEAL